MKKEADKSEEQLKVRVQSFDIFFMVQEYFSSAITISSQPLTPMNGLELSWLKLLPFYKYVFKILPLFGVHLALLCEKRHSFPNVT